MGPISFMQCNTHRGSAVCRALCQALEGCTDVGVWALPLGFKEKYVTSVWEEVIHESSFREQMGFR